MAYRTTVSVCHMMCVFVLNSQSEVGRLCGGGIRGFAYSGTSFLVLNNNKTDHNNR